MDADDIIIFADVSGSSAAVANLGDEAGNKLVADRLAEVLCAFTKADPTVKQRGRPAGDSFLATGNDLAKIYKAAVLMQHWWKTGQRHKGVLPVRIALVRGEYETADDGTLRGSSINFTSRLSNVCEDGGVVVSESARAVLLSHGLGQNLDRKEARLKGFGRESYYETNGAHPDEIDEAEPERPVAVVQEPGDHQHASVEVGAMGVSVRVRSRRLGDILSFATHIALPVVFALAALWQIQDWREQDEKMRSQFRSAATTEHRLLAEQGQRVEVRLREIVYITLVCSRSKDECNQLDLEKPESLRRR